VNVLAVLGYAVFERTADGSLTLAGDTPGWLPDGALTDAFPYLEVFLPEAEEFWSRTDSPPTLDSDFWTQPGATGKELHFCATAISGEQKLLLIQCAEQRFQEMRNLVQYAHETSLAREQIAKLSRELERATEAKSEFLARMSHEIRTPLNALLGMAELLSETRLDDQQREYVRVFQRAGDNLLSVINDILDYSKVEAGRIELENVGFDLAEVVADALEIAGVRARSKGLEISRRIQPGVPTRLKGDPGRLRQILLNLLGNATKFTERGGISLLVEPQQGTLHFAVSDTGVGIPADRLAAIFERFSQAEASTSRQYGGTGLGLAISKRFVELMGGRMWVESTVGSGTTFHFTAQFDIDESPVSVRRPGREDSVAAIRPLRILLADDSEENRFLIRAYLKESGCSIDEVANGAQAAEKFSENSYDVVLMDSDMPVLDGYGATRRMRALERERGSVATPIVALTAHAMREAEERSFQAGCSAHLTKPLKKATLLETIRRLLPESGNGDAVHVSVEDWLKPVVGGYLEKRRADVGKLWAALDRADYSVIRLLGHQMAGTGGGYGFAPITEIGSALEEAALASDAGRVRASIQELERYLGALQVE
jgi:signal transduction histidine kinase/CheY-like chemotaxis protein